MLIFAPSLAAPLYAAAEESGPAAGGHDAAAFAPFPPPLESYGDPPDAGLWEVLSHRVAAQPLNLWATILFVCTGPVAWTPALVMSVATFAGGVLGGRLAGRMSPAWLRRVVVAIGVAAGIACLVR